MKQGAFLFCFLLFVQCSSLNKPDFQSVVSPPQEKERLLDELREIAQVGSALSKENFEFISKKLKVSIARYKALKKKVVRLEAQVNQLVVQLKEQKQINQKINLEPITVEMDDSLLGESDSKSVSDKSQSTPDPHQEIFDGAKALFEEKGWESAIAKFEEYRRKASKKDSNYRKATLYIGRSFRNLKLKQEAQVFFNELIKAYPESEEAHQAKALLK